MQGYTMVPKDKKRRHKNRLPHLSVLYCTVLYCTVLSSTVRIQRVRGCTHYLLYRNTCVHIIILWASLSSTNKACILGPTVTPVNTDGTCLSELGTSTLNSPAAKQSRSEEGRNLPPCEGSFCVSRSLQTRNISLLPRNSCLRHVLFGISLL